MSGYASKAGSLVDRRIARGVTAQFSDCHLLLDQEETDVTGPWTDNSLNKAASVEVVPAGGFNGSVQLYGTNAPNPQPGDTGVAIGAAATAEDLITLPPVRFVRAVITGHTAGSVSAFLHGVS